MELICIHNLPPSASKNKETISTHVYTYDYSIYVFIDFLYNVFIIDTKSKTKNRRLEFTKHLLFMHFLTYIY